MDDGAAAFSMSGTNRSANPGAAQPAQMPPALGHRSIRAGPPCSGKGQVVIGPELPILTRHRGEPGRAGSGPWPARIRATTAARAAARGCAPGVPAPGAVLRAGSSPTVEAGPGSGIADHLTNADLGIH